MIDHDPTTIFMRHIETAIEIWLERLAEADDAGLAAADREKDNLYQLLQHGLHLADTVQLTAYTALEAFELVERQGYWQEWHDLLQRAITSLSSADQELHVLLLNRISQIKRLQNHTLEAIDATEQALEIASKINNPRLMALSRYNLAEAHLKAGHFNRVDELGNAARAYFEEQAAEPRLVASLLNTLGESARLQEKSELADTLLNRAVQLAAENDIPFLEARFRSNLALNLNTLGRPREAIAQLELAERRLHGSVNEFDRVTIQLNKGFIFAGQKQWQEAADSFKKVDISYLAQRQNHYLLALTHTNLGFALLMNEELQVAEPFLKDGIRYWEIYGDQINLANAVGCMGKLHRAQGETAAAVADFQRALTILKPIDKEKNLMAGRYAVEFEQYVTELTP